MSFLRRLRGGERQVQVELNVNYFKRIRDDATVDVVGEAYRQGGVLWLVGSGTNKALK